MGRRVWDVSFRGLGFRLGFSVVVVMQIDEAALYERIVENHVNHVEQKLTKPWNWDYI